MRATGLTAIILLPAVLSACGGGQPADPAYVAQTDAWHAERVARLVTPTGWLSLVGLHPLHEGPNTVGSAEGADARLVPKAPPRVGRLDVGPAGAVRFLAEPGVDVRRHADAGAGPVAELDLVTDTAGAPTELAVGTLVMHVIDRGGRLFLRVKDTRAEALRTFTGIERFAVDPRWRITARLEAGPPTVAVPNVLGQMDQEPSPGTLVFSIDGRACRLVPTGAPGEDLFLVFADPTNGPQTYPGGRFLVTDPPAADGTVVLDFNRSTNPPCAFSDFATCPLPPPGNTLPVAVTAGEKRWGSH
ncbi:MAG: DUF1684 domain-containing protein [Candidatus Krumholzibacteriia bacterium]